MSVSIPVTTDKNRTTVYIHEEVFNLMRTWRRKLKISRENNDSYVLAEAASVYFLIGEERLDKLLRIARTQNDESSFSDVEAPIVLAIELLSNAIDAVEEES